MIHKRVALMIDAPQQTSARRRRATERRQGRFSVSGVIAQRPRERQARTIGYRIKPGMTVATRPKTDPAAADIRSNPRHVVSRAMNRLQNEASPYLRQHAENPVDWYPWGPEAFALAQSENKPVLLSIGYSSCHWCHVMAHESFEDEATAQVMNENFVNIKVDREERPDVDAIYMEAVQAMSGSGGWPMTVFMTPDAKPFFAGTYFPKEPTQGHPGFVSVLTAVSQAWTTQQDEVVEQAQQLREAIADRVSLDAPGGAVDITVNEEQWTKNAIATATNEADMTWGGFGKAPKFPHVETLDLLLANNTTEAVTVSLDTMAAGGIYDQIGEGFSRYSVDAF